MSRAEHDIKAPDGYLLGGLRKVRADGTILFQRGYWQAPRDWAGERVWVHTEEDRQFPHAEYVAAAPPGLHIFAAQCAMLAVRCDRTARPDAKPAYRRPEHKAWAARCRGEAS